MNATVTRSAAPGRDDRAAGRAEPTDDERAAAAAILKMISGLHISRAVYVAAELGIADRLAGGPASAAELAAATQTHERSLYRVLRLLASLGVLAEQEPRTFRLTVLGDRLRTDVPASMRSWARLVDAVGGVRAFEPILHTVRTGEPGVDAAYGMGLFEFLERHPGHAASFDAAMSERTSAFAPSVAAACDFARVRTVADVGGGRGTLLAAVLRAHGHLRGILLEAPAVAAGARPVLQAAGVGDRCEVVAGDFFAGVPDGADRYLLANVLHDWDDDRAAAILARCREAMPPGGRVLIVERLIPDDPGQAVTALLSDINMLVITGGVERTATEYGELLAAAGLRLGQITPVAAPYAVIEGLPA
jgi:O-methyltransferase domain/Dimerisation domain